MKRAADKASTGSARSSSRDVSVQTAGFAGRWGRLDIFRCYIAIYTSLLM
jgi:hypothetical protein